jgi:hypothetical protein
LPKVAHFRSMCVPNLRSIEITQQVRDYSDKLEKKQLGMDEMSETFRELASEVCVDTNAARGANEARQ